MGSITIVFDDQNHLASLNVSDVMIVEIAYAQDEYEGEESDDTTAESEDDSYDDSGDSYYDDTSNTYDEGVDDSYDGSADSYYDDSELMPDGTPNNVYDGNSYYNPWVDNLRLPSTDPSLNLPPDVPPVNTSTDTSNDDLSSDILPMEEPIPSQPDSSGPILCDNEIPCPQEPPFVVDELPATPPVPNIVVPPSSQPQEPPFVSDELPAIPPQQPPDLPPIPIIQSPDLPPVDSAKELSSDDLQAPITPQFLTPPCESAFNCNMFGKASSVFNPLNLNGLSPLNPNSPFSPINPVFISYLMEKYGPADSTEKAKLWMEIMYGRSPGTTNPANESPGQDIVGSPAPSFASLGLSSPTSSEFARMVFGPPLDFFNTPLPPAVPGPSTTTPGTPDPNTATTTPGTPDPNTAPIAGTSPSFPSGTPPGSSNDFAGSVGGVSSNSDEQPKSKRDSSGGQSSTSGEQPRRQITSGVRVLTDVNVIVSVKNDNGGNRKSNDFVIKVNSTGNRPTPPLLFTGSATPGTTVKFASPGEYDVLLAKLDPRYDVKYYGACTGGIKVYTSKTPPSVAKCIIVVDDKLVQPSQNNQQSQVTWKTFNEREGLFTVQYPSNWTPDQIPGLEDVADFNSIFMSPEWSADSGADVQFVQHNQKSVFNTPRESLESEINTLQNDPANTKFEIERSIECSKYVLNDLQACSVIYQRQGQDIANQAVLIVNSIAPDGKQYEVYYHGAFNVFNHYLLTAENMIESFNTAASGSQVSDFSLSRASNTKPKS